MTTLIKKVRSSLSEYTVNPVEDIGFILIGAFVVTVILSAIAQMQEKKPDLGRVFCYLRISSDKYTYNKTYLGV